MSQNNNNSCSNSRKHQRYTNLVNFIKKQEKLTFKHLRDEDGSMCGLAILADYYHFPWNRYYTNVLTSYVHVDHIYLIIYTFLKEKMELNINQCYWVMENWDKIYLWKGKEAAREMLIEWANLKEKPTMWEIS